MLFVIALFASGGESTTTTTVTTTGEDRCVLGGGRVASYRRYPYTYPMCVHERGDLVSDVIVAGGYWADCDTLLEIASRTPLVPADPRVIAIDIGANIGSCSLWLAAHGYRVIAFEPGSANLKRFRATLDMIPADMARRITLHDAGVWDAEFNAQLYVEAGNRGNSIVASDRNQLDRLSERGSRAHYEPEGVRLVTLDHAAPTNNVTVAVMKMDCQGCELHALRGAHQLLHKHAIRAIRLEFAVRWLIKTGTSTSPVDLLEYLYDRGFRFDPPMDPHHFQPFVDALLARPGNSGFTDLVLYQTMNST
jgi:FkbM family methyltransferase